MTLMVEDAKLKYKLRMIKMDKIYLVRNNDSEDIKAHTVEELDSLAKVLVSDMNMSADSAPITAEPHSYDYFFNERGPDYITLIGYYMPKENKLIKF